MKDHAREKDTAAWLAHEYDGSDGKTPFAVRAGKPRRNGASLAQGAAQARPAHQGGSLLYQVEQDSLDDVDPIAIRETLAQSGIVDGHVVDPEKLDNDPFVQQVMRDVEAISRETAQADQTTDFLRQFACSCIRQGICCGPWQRSGKDFYNPTVPPYAMWGILSIWMTALTRSPSCGMTPCSFCPPAWYIPSTGQSVRNSLSSFFGQIAATLLYRVSSGKPG